MRDEQKNMYLWKKNNTFLEQVMASVSISSSLHRPCNFGNHVRKQQHSRRNYRLSMRTNEATSDHVLTQNMHGKKVFSMLLTLQQVNRSILRLKYQRALGMKDHLLQSSHMSVVEESNLEP